MSAEQTQGAEEEHPLPVPEDLKILLDDFTTTPETLRLLDKDDRELLEAVAGMDIEEIEELYADKSKIKYPPADYLKGLAYFLAFPLGEVSHFLGRDDGRSLSRGR